MNSSDQYSRVSSDPWFFKPVIAWVLLLGGLAMVFFALAALSLLSLFFAAGGGVLVGCGGAALYCCGRNHRNRPT